MTLNEKVGTSAKQRWPHQWRSGSALKACKWELPGSISGRACRPSRSEISVVFSETRVKYGL